MNTTSLNAYAVMSARRALRAERNSLINDIKRLKIHIEKEEEKNNGNIEMVALHKQKVISIHKQHLKELVSIVSVLSRVLSSLDKCK
jgi:hypothetical protein